MARRNPDLGPVNIFATYGAPHGGQHPVLDAALDLAERAKSLPVPYVTTSVSQLGGPERASATIKLSLDPKASWVNGIFQNSRHALFSVDPRDGTIEMFSGHGVPKFRKARFKAPSEAIAKLTKWVKEAGPKSNPRSTLPPKPLDLYDLNGPALLQVVDRLPAKVAKQYRESRERGSSVRVAALAAIEAAYARQNAAHKNPRKPKGLSGGDVMSLVPVAYKGRMAYGKNFCASDNLQPHEVDAIVARLAKEGCATALAFDVAPARGLRPYRTVISVVRR